MANFEPLLGTPLIHKHKRAENGSQAKVFYTVGPSDADYITDGTADDVQIQQALDAADAAGGGTVYIKEGTYSISAAMTIGNKTKVMGDGFATILQHVAGAGFNGLLKNKDQTTGNSGIIICDLAIDGNAANVTGSDPRDTIWLKEVWDSKVMRCYIYDSVDSAIVLDSTLTVDNQVSDNIIDGALDIGIYVSAASKTIVSNNTVRDTGSYGIRLITTGNTECIVSNNRVNNCGQTANVDGITVATSGGEKNLIIGNHVSRSGRNGLLVSNVAYTQITGNFFFFNDQHGIHVQTVGRGVITGNMCHQNSQQTSNTYSGILLQNCQDITVVGNRCADIGSGTRQKYGIEEQGTSDNNIIMGNMTDRNQTAAVLTVGASTMVLNNRSYTTNNINGTLSPLSSDGGALGTSSLMWSDLFLASGGVINFNNGDLSLTHSADTLTIAGGDIVPSTNNAVSLGNASLAWKTTFTNHAVFNSEVSVANLAGLATIDWTRGNKFRLSITSHATVNFIAPSGPCNLMLKTVNSTTSLVTVSWPTGTLWAGGSPTFVSHASGVQMSSFYYDGSKYWGATNTGFI